MAPGSRIDFTDKEGKEHNALVIHAFDTCLNIAHVDPDNSDNSFGNNIIKETSVPYFEEGMKAFYVDHGARHA